MLRIFTDKEKGVPPAVLDGHRFLRKMDKDKGNHSLTMFAGE